MKRSILFVIVLLSVAGIVSAADTGEVGTGFSLTGGTHLDSIGGGGFGELGFALKKVTDGKGLELRNYFSVFGWGNYVKADDSATLLGQYKFTFGGFRSDSMIIARSYGLIAAGAGCEILDTNIFSFIWDVEVGGGAHLYLQKNHILSVEMGGGVRSTAGEPGRINGYGFLRAAMGGIW